MTGRTRAEGVAAGARAMLVACTLLVWMLEIAAAPRAAEAISTATPAPSATATPAPAPGARRETLEASQIDLYIGAAVLEGHGHVRAVLADGTRATADAFSYNLHTGRLLLAGHVSMTNPPQNLALASQPDPPAFTAAAVAREAQGTLYALVTKPTPKREQIDPSTLEARAPHAPPNAFAFPNVESTPWMSATKATVIEGTLVTLDHATFLYPVHGATIPSYVYVFSSNTYYATNTLPYASFDLPLPFYGGPRALDTLHLRFAQDGGASLGYDQRLVFGERAYGLLSLAPLTQSDRSAELTLYQRMSPNVYQTFTATGYRAGNIMQVPTQASAALTYNVTDALRHSYVQLSLGQAYDSLVAGGVPDHPSSAQVSWYGYDHPLGRSGISYRLHSSFGFLRDAYGLGSQVLPVNADQAWVKGAGVSLSSPVVNGPFHTQLSAFDERDLSWYSTGPGYGSWSDNLVLTGARKFSDRTSVITTYQTQLFSSPAALYRTATVNLTYLIPARMQLVASLQRDDDVLPPGFGLRAPYVASFDLRIHFTRYGTLDLQRSYFFNFEGQRWSPQLTFSILP